MGTHASGAERRASHVEFAVFWYPNFVAKGDRDMEWRLVATKGRESCRWQADETNWVALSLGSGGDITKVVVTDSAGRSEVVEGYEQGLNLARRWRNDWHQADAAQPLSTTSGPWLPPLPGRGQEQADDSGQGEISGNNQPTRNTGPSLTPATRGRTSPTAQGSYPPPNTTPQPPATVSSRWTQPKPLSRSSQIVPATASPSDERSGSLQLSQVAPADPSRDPGSTAPKERTWAPRSTGPITSTGSSHSFGKSPLESTQHHSSDRPDADVPPGKPPGPSSGTGRR
jgi:hypothetical protein